MSKPQLKKKTHLLEAKGFAVLMLIALVSFMGSSAIAQVDTTGTSPNTIYIIITNSGGEFVGKILRQDSREVVIETLDRGEIVIPKFEIKSMREVKPGDLSASGEYLPAQVFATRYFITTNGLPIEKGESYILWNLWGPDFQFGVGENLTVGILTSWVGVPIIGSVKYSIPLGTNSSLGIGTLLGTGSWAAPDFGIALPYGALTFGGRRNNLTFSAGYGAIWAEGEGGGRVLLSVAGMTQLGRSVSLVFDSFIIPEIGADLGAFALITPGLRFQSKDDKAFQFGFAGMVVGGELVPAPIPMVQWFKKF